MKPKVFKNSNRIDFSECPGAQQLGGSHEALFRNECELVDVANNRDILHLDRLHHLCLIDCLHSSQLVMRAVYMVLHILHVFKYICTCICMPTRQICEVLVPQFNGQFVKMKFE